MKVEFVTSCTLKNQLLDDWRDNVQAKEVVVEWFVEWEIRGTEEINAYIKTTNVVPTKMTIDGDMVDLSKANIHRDADSTSILPYVELYDKDQEDHEINLIFK